MFNLRYKTFNQKNKLEHLNWIQVDIEAILRDLPWFVERQNFYTSEITCLFNFIPKAQNVNLFMETLNNWQQIYQV